MADTKVSAFVDTGSVSAKSSFPFIADTGTAPRNERASLDKVDDFLAATTKTLINKTIKAGTNTGVADTGTAQTLDSKTLTAVASIAMAAGALADTGTAQTLDSKTLTAVAGIVMAAGALADTGTGQTLDSKTLTNVASIAMAAGALADTGTAQSLDSKTFTKVQSFTARDVDTGGSPLNFGHASGLVAPAAPVNGDFWMNSFGPFVHVNGGTFQIALDGSTLTNSIFTTPSINDTGISGNRYQISAAGRLAANRGWTLPILTANDTGVFASHEQTLRNKTLGTGSRLGDDLRMDTYGLTNTFTAAHAIALGQVCFVGDSGKMHLADADTGPTSTTLLGMSTEATAFAAGDTGEFLLLGQFTDTGGGLIPGANYYLSNVTAGAVDTGAPSDTGDFVRIVGTAISATEFFFNPDRTYVENA